MTVADSYDFDVFLCHSTMDKPTISDLAKRLARDGLRVWLDIKAIPPGDSVVHAIDRGLLRSRTLVLGMSQNSFGADWLTLERQTAIFRDPLEPDRRFVPLRLDDSPIKDSVKHYAYVDWRHQDERQYEKLREACRPSAETKEFAPEYSSLKLGRTSSSVFGVSYATDGRIAASSDSGGTITLWSIDSGNVVRSLRPQIPNGAAYSVAVNEDAGLVVGGYADNTIRFWERTGSKYSPIIKTGHEGAVRAVDVTPDGKWIVSGSDDGTIRLWNWVDPEDTDDFVGHRGAVQAVQVSRDGTSIVSGGADCTVRIWDAQSRGIRRVLRGHTGIVTAVALAPNNLFILSASADATIRMWDTTSGKCTAIWEGHEAPVLCVHISGDSRLAVSGGRDRTIRLWDVSMGSTAATLRAHTGSVFGARFAPTEDRIVSVSDDSTLRVWNREVEQDEDASGFREAQTVRYTNAKVLIVGDTGVGKTGLALRLARDRYEPTDSTDGAWATQLKMPNSVTLQDVDREIWLWDFAGQADYRLIHQLFMDETSLAILVFNPQSENPFEGLGQWNRALSKAARRPFQKMVVAGRCDRGKLMVSRGSFDGFCEEHDLGPFVETSAKTGEGCAALSTLIMTSIDWDSIPWTASPKIFKKLKDEILKLRDDGIAILRMSELLQQLRLRLISHRISGNSIVNEEDRSGAETTFSPEEVGAVVGLLAGPGIVQKLDFGDCVLLQPERINSYAAAVIRSVRANPHELGSILEEKIFAGDIDFQDMQRLPLDEEVVILRAMHQLMVDRGVCLRQHTESGTQLVFPSYFKRDLPEAPGHPPVLVRYLFAGSLDEIYATLVVQLFHTRAFENDHLWRFAAEFKTQAGRRLGMKLLKKNEGAGELDVFCDPEIPDDTKVTFIKYIHEHLLLNGQDVKRLRHYSCSECGHPARDSELAWQLLERDGKDANMICQKCREDISLWDLIETKVASAETQQLVKQLEINAKTSIDNESRELILEGHARTITGEAGQIYRGYTGADHGIDGEIEFKDWDGNASGKRLYLQLKSGDSYLRQRKSDGEEVFQIKKPRWAKYWMSNAYPVMLVIRASNGHIRWMNVTEYLREESKGSGKQIRQIIFDGEQFTAVSLQRMRDRFLPPRPLA